MASTIILIVMTCTGCMTASSYADSISGKNYSNTQDTAIPQTDIKGMVEGYLSTQSSAGSDRKAVVIMMDGFRANAIEGFFGYGQGIARLAAEGGLYFTKPANMDTDSNIGRGTNMLSIMTGVEPSAMDILKSTDVKRETPKSMAANFAANYQTAFYTDYSNYINHHLAQELAVNLMPSLTATAFDDIHAMQYEMVSSLKSKSVILAASSNLYDAAGGDYSTGNVSYMNAVINFNSYVEEIINQAQTRNDEEWLIVVTSTFGGEEQMNSNKSIHNSLTFLASNRKITDGKFV